MSAIFGGRRMALVARPTVNGRPRLHWEARKRPQKRYYRCGTALAILGLAVSTDRFRTGEFQ
jgi:hypothetical protein